MWITSKGRYALRATLALAEMGKNGDIISINHLSEAEDISSIFLEQIFFKLKKAKIVKSVRGPGGGFSFDRPLDSVTVREILTAAGEDLSMKFCDKSAARCGRMSECRSHKVFATVTDKVNTYLDSITIQTVLDSGEFQPDP